MSLAKLRFGPPETADAVALLRTESGLTAPSRNLARVLGLPVQRLVERSKHDPGDVTTIPLLDRDQPRVIYLVGVGAADPHAQRRAGAALTRAARDVEQVAVAAPDAAFIEGMLLASYKFNTDSKVSFVVSTELTDARRQDIERAIRIAEAVALARDLTNTPSLEKTPRWLADRATAIARKAGLTSAVRAEKQLESEGFGGIVGVGSGSSRPPRFIELSYQPEHAQAHVVLIGKGVTFDSGGLSLKRGETMALMKTDMGGAAAVIATMSALKDLQSPYQVTALVAAAENMPSGTAMRPGDVITQYGGRTVEVVNTDAEGRLLLADALAYADANLRPDVIVDVATLTGAVRVALGKKVAGLFSTSDRLATALETAAERAGEQIWRLPLVDEYRDAIDSDVADLRNVAHDDRNHRGGAIVAALFLREFAGARPWAHLDIAGAGRAEATEDDVTKGGTGFGVRTLLRWLTTPRAVGRR